MPNPGNCPYRHLSETGEGGSQKQRHDLREASRLVGGRPDYSPGQPGPVNILFPWSEGWLGRTSRTTRLGGRPSGQLLRPQQHQWGVPRGCWPESYAGAAGGSGLTSTSAPLCGLLPSRLTSWRERWFTSNRSYSSKSVAFRHWRSKSILCRVWGYPHLCSPPILSVPLSFILSLPSLKRGFLIVQFQFYSTEDCSPRLRFRKGKGESFPIQVLTVLWIPEVIKVCSIQLSFASTEMSYRQACLCTWLLPCCRWGRTRYAHGQSQLFPWPPKWAMTLVCAFPEETRIPSTTTGFLEEWAPCHAHCALQVTEEISRTWTKCSFPF